MKRLTTLALFALFSILSCASLCAAQQTFKGEWEGGFCGKFQPCGEVFRDRMWMALKSIHSSPYRDHNSFLNLEDSEIKQANITPDASGSFPVHLVLTRDAGTVVIEGQFKDGRGSGSYSFTANADFINAMKAMGYSELSPDELARMAVRDVNRAFVGEMRSAGYDNATVDQLVRLRNRNMTSAFIHEMKAAGLERLPVEQLVRLRNRGVSADFIQSLNDVGYRGLSVEQLVRLRNRGVNADFIRQMNAAGNNNLSVEDLIYARRHGTTRERARRTRRIM